MPLFGLSKKKKNPPAPELPGRKPFCPPRPCKNSSLSPSPPRHPCQAYSSPPNIVVNHHSHIAAAPPTPRPTALVRPKNSIAKLNLGSVVNLATDLLPGEIPHFFDDGLPPWHASSSRMLNQGAALCDQLSSKFDNVLTLIDRDRYAGDGGDLFSSHPLAPSQPTCGEPAGILAPTGPATQKTKLEQQKGQTTAVASSLISANYFAKVDLYANSKLPPDLPPMRLYIATYPLLSLAAKYSDRVYQQPQGAERFFHIDADWRAGTKAMVIKSVPMDHANTIVFAIRGTATFMDWAVNLNMAPASPAGFLDDLGNLCHAGFLSVARKMVSPVAARLHQLLEEDPGRAAYSLLITGHSAGGAVAALLYSHMLAVSQQAGSELNHLASCFRRIHCVTFGAPPISLLPLAKPDRNHLRKSIFLSFVNEGDPVARADKAYVKSLFELCSSSVPSTALSAMSASAAGLAERASDASMRSHRPSKSNTRHRSRSHHRRNGDHSPKPVWKVPQATLSNGGRIVVLRSGDPQAAPAGGRTVEQRLNEGVVAQLTTDEQLRQVIWGDPVCHVMKLYAGRIETLAIGAVTAG